MMKAVVWEDKLRQVSVKKVPRPKIQDPLDAIVRMTSAAICGTDLHIYNGRLETPAGLTLGHEMIGVVDAVGEGVEPELLKVDDRVVVWCLVSCGKCERCVVGLTSYCVTKERGFFGGPSFSGIESYAGGQGLSEHDGTAKLGCANQLG